MNTPSAFQMRYPLSRKKFWKKMLGNSLTLLFVSLVLGVGAATVVSVLVIASRPQTGVETFIGLGALAFVAIFALSVVLYAWYVTAYIRSYFYDASEQFLTIRKGVFAPTEIHVPYGRIQDVYVDQDILDRIMGIYDVHIASATATSGLEAHIDGVDTQIAEELKNILLNRIHSGSAPAPQGGNIPTPPTQPPAQPPQPGAFDSRSFPIEGSWLALSFLNAIWVALVYSVMLWFLAGRFLMVLGVVTAWRAVAVYIALYVGVCIWSVLWRSSYRFEFAPQFVLVKKGVVMREEKHVPYKALQDVVLRRGIMERLFGLSTVAIENAAIAQGKNNRSSRIVIPGQSFERGTKLVSELNRIMAANQSGTGNGL